MTLYEEFGLPPNATPDEVRRAHKSLARLLHPDNFQDEEMRRLAECQMKRINQAYTTLNDQEQRRRYDLEQALGPASRAPLPPQALSSAWIRRREQVFSMLGGCAATFALTLLFEPQPQLPNPVAHTSVSAHAAAPASTVVVPRARTEQSVLSEIRPPVHRQTAKLPLIGVRSGAPSGREVPAPSSQAAASPLLLAAEPAVSPTSPLGARDRANRTEGAVKASQPSSLAGTWFYIPTSRRGSEDVYPPEYIELVVEEEPLGTIRGRYRGRFKVADLAISPEVQFQFEGSGNAERVPWVGNAGSRGQIQLRLVSDNTLAVNWFTDQMGGAVTLSSGSAVLVKRRDP